MLAVGDGYLRTWVEQTAADRADHAELSASTACRAWRLAEDGRHCAKADAAAWVLERAPDMEAARSALGAGTAPQARPVDDAALLSQLAAVPAVESVRDPQ
ncbi:MAG: hypothetical protein ICV64_11500 [Thermoleophilia bacterium]|nr:hypothetical protein [Thermoleophilia bacterium]